MKEEDRDWIMYTGEKGLLALDWMIRISFLPHSITSSDKFKQIEKMYYSPDTEIRTLALGLLNTLEI